MMTLADVPRVGEIEVIQDNDTFAGFSCGIEHAWERTLNKTVHRLADTGGPPGTRAHIVEDESPGAEGALIAVVSFFPWWLGESYPELSLPPVEGAMCIQALGVTESYRKSLVPADSGEMPVGAWLLDWTLERIRSLSPRSMPPVWALVHEDNERCHRMLGGQGFGSYEIQGWPYDVWVRASSPHQPQD